MTGAASAARAARLLAVALVLGLVLFGEIPSRGRWATDVANFAHGPALAVVTLLVLQLLSVCDGRDAPTFRRYWLAIAIVVPLAAVSELLQLLLGRDASFADLLRDALGIGAAVAFSVAYDRRLEAAPRGRTVRAAGVLVGVTCCTVLVAPLLLTAAAYAERERRFPVLVDFSTPGSMYFVAAYGGARIDRARLPVMAHGGAPDTVGLQVQVGSGLPWAVALWEPKPGWRGYHRLCFDIANPTDDRLVLRVRVRDQYPRRERSQRDIGDLEIPPGSRQTLHLALPLPATAGLAAPFDLEGVRAAVLTSSPGNRAAAFYVAKIWLE